MCAGARINIPVYDPDTKVACTLFLAIEDTYWKD